jgi:hypothetical protein
VYALTLEYRLASLYVSVYEWMWQSAYALTLEYRLASLYSSAKEWAWKSVYASACSSASML